MSIPWVVFAWVIKNDDVDAKWEMIWVTIY